MATIWTVVLPYKSTHAPTSFSRQNVQLLHFHAVVCRISSSTTQSNKMVKTAADSSSSSSINVVDQTATEMKYKGVRKRKWGKYVSEIRLPNSRERIWLGSYDTAEKAARAFDAAQFCLRGHGGKFNFPDDPPDIAGGQSLTRAEIQVVAQQYGNRYGSGSTCEQSPPRSSSNLDVARPVDLVDLSFWDMVDSNGGGPQAGDVPDYGLFPELDVHMPPYFVPKNHEDEEDRGYYDNGNVPFYLWNF